MKTLSLLFPLAAGLALSACSQTNITVLTQAPPGRVAAVDVDNARLTLSRGLAVALECTEWSEDYSGPCRDMSVTLDDEDLADVLPAHLDALQGDVVRSTSGDLDARSSVSGPSDRQGVIVAGRTAGRGSLVVETAGAPVELELVILDPPETEGEDAR